MGLTTALQLKQTRPHVQVTVLSDRHYTSTTSHGSGGLWEPYQIVGTPDELIDKWGGATFSHLTRILQSPVAAQAGVALTTCHSLFAGPPPALPSWRGIVHNFRELDGAALARMGFAGQQAAWGFETIVADQSYYLAWLAGELERAGGAQFVQRTVGRLEDVCAEGYDVVFNCAGMGARGVAGDAACFPIRGQVRRVRAPWIKHGWFFGSGTHYVIPNVDAVVVGGTQQHGRDDESVDDVDTDAIWRVVTAALPSLLGAPVLSDWAGLRPGRTSGVRLDRQVVTTSGRATPVIHNYGHGGSGVTLHWGCVQDAVALAAGDLSAGSRAALPSETSAAA